MSSGTFVKVERYYNHHHYKSIEEIDACYSQAVKEREDVWCSILSLCMATPKDITPQDEDPVQYVNERLSDYRELLDEYDYKLQALHDIKEGWETREED